jgi:hypothetical protein
MVGIPHETVKTFWRTLELNRRVHPTVVQICHYRPHPGTDLTRTACEEHLFDGNFDVLPQTYYERLDPSLSNFEELSALACIGNLVIDAWPVRALARALLLLPVGTRVRLRAFGWLDRHQKGIRRRLGYRDSRWAPLERYQ